MQDMRRIDVWIGRAVAVAGVIYVVLASVWPFAVEANAPTVAVNAASATTAPGTAQADTVDLKLARVLSDVATKCERRVGESSSARAASRVARSIDVLSPLTIAAGHESNAPRDPLPALVAVAAAIAISAVALRDQRRTTTVFDIR